MCVFVCKMYNSLRRSDKIEIYNFVRNADAHFMAMSIRLLVKAKKKKYPWQ